MKKKLFFEFAKCLLQKTSFRVTAFTALALLTLQPSFAQQWTVLGNEDQLSAVASSYTSIVVLNEVPYVIYKDNTANVIKVKKRINATNLWEQVGDNIGSNLTYTRIYLDKANNLYITYVDAGNGNKLAVKKYNSTTLLWEALKDASSVDKLYVSTGSVTYNVSQLSSSPRSSLAFDSSNKPYIAYGEGAALTPTVKKFDGTSWVSLAGTTVNPTGFAMGVSLVIDSANVPWLAYCNSASATATSGAMALYKFSGGNWTSVASTITGIRHTSMTLNSAGNLAIAYFNTGNGNKATVITYNKTAGTWGTADALGTKDSPNISLIKDASGNLYCSFIDAIASTWVSAARVFKQNAGTTAWTELKDPTVSNGIDDLTGNLTIGAGSFYPFVVYTKTNSSGIITPFVRTYTVPDAVVTTPKQIEFLNRGVVAVRKSVTEVFISWRLLGTDPSGIAFNIYRDNVKLNASPITTSTNYLDTVSTNGTYVIKTVISGAEGAASSPVSVWANNQLSIPLQIPVGGTTPDGIAYTYTANDASVGDVDGDGEYEIFLKWDPTALNNNSGGYSGEQIFDCYKMNGTKLWRINLGKNVNAGPHFNPFMVYDFDGDGKAEIILKTADGTVDGAGVVIGSATVDYRNTSGWVQQGPEYLTVFNGLTGAAMKTIAYQPARANTADWGDNYGNRQDRFVSAVAYLDGARPSLIVGRGYYDKLMRAAYDWRGGQLTLRWIFDSKDANDPGNNALSSQGNHQMTIGDVDGDGKDEIINGSSAINDNGKRLWTFGQGHGDALHMSDMDPDRPGLEIWQCLESETQYKPYGIRLNDAKTGEMIFGDVTTGDVGRALAADIDPNHRGYEMWSSSGNLYNVQDGQIGTAKPTNGSQSVNGAVWWDGDLGRELLDGTIMDKWNPATQSLNRLFTIYQAAPVSSNNDTKKNPCLTGDILGDWREEIILRRTDNTALILFTTNISTDYRITTLMHDPQYRTAVAWQNSGYNQPPHPSFFLGYDMPVQSKPNIVVKKVKSSEISKQSVSFLSGLAVSPNPSSGPFNLQINGDKSTQATISVIDINGRTIIQKEVKLIAGDQTIPFNISHYPQGVYLVKVQTEEGEQTLKVIIEK